MSKRRIHDGLVGALVIFGVIFGYFVNSPWLLILIIIGINLTESADMYPTAAVSGFYYSHPDSRYFGVGMINRDQVADYAHRKDMDIKHMERWLSSNLGYDPKE